MSDLTDKQRAMLEYIGRFTTENRRPPAIREVGAALGIRSPNGVCCHLNALRRKGYLAPADRTARSLRLLRNADGSEWHEAVAERYRIIAEYEALLRECAVALSQCPQFGFVPLVRAKVEERLGIMGRAS